MTNNYIARVVENCFDEWLLTPRKGLKIQNFEERSYVRWCVQQLCEEIRKNPQTRPSETVMIFIKRITEYKGNNRKLRMIYKTVENVAWDVWDFVNCLEE